MGMSHLMAQYFKLFRSFSNIEKLPDDLLDKFNVVRFQNELLKMPIHNLKRLNLTNSSQLNWFLKLNVDNLKSLRFLTIYYDKQRPQSNLNHNILMAVSKLTNLKSLGYLGICEGKKGRPIRLSNNILIEISKLKNLIHLKLGGYPLQFKTYNSIEKLKNLKSIELGLAPLSSPTKMIEMYRDLKGVLFLLKSSLKRLNFKFYSYDPGCFDEQNLIVHLDGLNITHLNLGFERKKIYKLSKLIDLQKPYFVKNIDLILPDLQYLEISSTLEASEQNVLDMANTLSRIPSLQTIKLRFCDRGVSKLFGRQIFEKCKKFKPRSNKRINEPSSFVIKFALESEENPQ